jgi:hypothetical protein
VEVAWPHPNLIQKTRQYFYEETAIHPDM